MRHGVADASNRRACVARARLGRRNMALCRSVPVRDEAFPAGPYRTQARSYSAGCRYLTGARAQRKRRILRASSLTIAMAAVNATIDRNCVRVWAELASSTKITARIANASTVRNG